MKHDITLLSNTGACQSDCTLSHPRIQ